MGDEPSGRGRGVGIALLLLVFLGAVGAWTYMRMISHPSERGAAACQAVERYIASISHHRSDAAWRTTTATYQTTTPLAAHHARWHDLLRAHGRITSVAVVERSASVDYSRLTIRATLGTADPHYSPQLDYDVVLGADGVMHVESGCEVTAAGCTPGPW